MDQFMQERIDTEEERQEEVWEDAYPTLFDKVAALLESLVKNDCFHNGNERTAYLVTKSFLLLNGVHLQIERNEALEFIVDIAQGTASSNRLLRCLKNIRLHR